MIEPPLAAAQPRLKGRCVFAIAWHLRSIRKTYRRTRLGYGSGDLVKGGAGALSAGLSTCQFNPEICESEAVGDAALRRNLPVQCDPAIVHTHASIDQNDVEVGLGVAQLRHRLAVGVLVRLRAALDLSNRSLGRILNLVDV